MKSLVSARSKSKFRVHSPVLLDKSDCVLADAALLSDVPVHRVCKELLVWLCQQH
jgi:hypothetical protein